jgi:hypothetical protein
VVQGVPMREVSAGRYEGELTVNSGMQVERGTLVGRLRYNGREDVMESRRAVSFQNTVIGGGINQNNALFDVLPLPNSQINTPRPTVQVTLNQGLQTNTARVLLDGTDVTSQVQLVGNTLRFVPMYDLSPGEHRVTVQAMDLAGRWINREWSFATYGASTGPLNPGLPPTVQLTNLAHGSAVPAIFTVQGQTTPYTTVQVQAEARRDLIPGWISLQNFNRTNTAQADAWGRFSIQMDASQVPPSTPLTLRIQATDQQGRVSQQSVLQVTRQ